MNVAGREGGGYAQKMQMGHFYACFDMCNMIGAHTGISRREIKLIYIWSQMPVVDEYHKEKVLSASFVDFLEAFGRVAELLLWIQNIKAFNLTTPPGYLGVLMLVVWPCMHICCSGFNSKGCDGNTFFT